MRRDGQTRPGGQRWRCASCHRRFTARSVNAFSGRRFSDDVIAVAVRWYVRYQLSHADWGCFSFVDDLTLGVEAPEGVPRDARTAPRPVPARVPR